jgi:hypothetical protein
LDEDATLGNAFTEPELAVTVGIQRFEAGHHLIFQLSSM